MNENNHSPLLKVGVFVQSRTKRSSLQTRRRETRKEGEMNDIMSKNYTIDCKKASWPSHGMPNGYEVAWHRDMGCHVFTADAIHQYIAEEQFGHRAIIHIQQNHTKLTDNWLDFLMVHTDLIPESWKRQDTFFLGTGYKTA